MIADFFLTEPWRIVAVVLVLALGVGRLSRVITYDDFPPAVRVRIWWATLTKDGPWAKLAMCQWCFTPWLMLFAIGWFFLGFVVLWIAWAWWIFWGWLAVSYLASLIIRRDEPED